MQLVTFEVETTVGSIRRLGAMNGSEIVDLTAANRAYTAGDSDTRSHAGPSIPSDMRAFLEGGRATMDAARSAFTFATEADVETDPSGARLGYDRSAVRLLSPLPRPTSIRDFITFEAHIGHFRDEIPDEWYELPVYYKGNPNSVVDPGDTVAWPTYTDRFDYELEVAAIIGTGGRDIAVEDASEHIAGYTIFNDFSARDIQAKERVVGLGPAKGKDFANGFGPCIATPDEIDPTDATMVARVDGEEWSRGNLGDMYHTFDEMVAHASMDEELRPGDVLGSGTVGGGCGPEVEKWLQPGDTISLSVEGIGTLEHRVGER